MNACVLFSDVLFNSGGLMTRFFGWITAALFLCSWVDPAAGEFVLETRSDLQTALSGRKISTEDFEGAVIESGPALWFGESPLDSTSGPIVGGVTISGLGLSWYAANAELGGDISSQMVADQHLSIMFAGPLTAFGMDVVTNGVLGGWSLINSNGEDVGHFGTFDGTGFSNPHFLGIQLEAGDDIAGIRFEGRSVAYVDNLQFGGALLKDPDGGPGPAPPKDPPPSADVPEPATLTLWSCLGGFGLLARLRRRKAVA